MGLSEIKKKKRFALNIHFTIEILYNLKIIGFVSSLVHKNYGIIITFH